MRPGQVAMAFDIEGLVVLGHVCACVKNSQSVTPFVLIEAMIHGYDVSVNAVAAFTRSAAPPPPTFWL